MQCNVYLLLFVTIFCVLHVSITESSFKRVCYLIGYNGNPHLPLIGANQMKWHLCTHVIFAFSSTNNGSIYANQSLVNYIRQMLNLTEAYNTNRNNVNFMVSVAGPDFSFVKHDEAITRFIDSVMIFLNKYGLDGIDIDWEFPYITGDKRNFSKLLKMIRARFDEEYKRVGRRLLLSVALTPIMYIADKSYQLHSINDHVSFVNLMTYDFHTPGTIPYTNHNSPLYSSKLDILYFKYFNVFFAAHYMKNLGLRKEQIMIGMPFYGYLYYLANPQFHDVYSLSNGTQVSITYAEICSEIDNSVQAKRVFDTASKVPYLYNGNRWITYDDTESLTIKAQWISDNAFGGTMSFALNYDDFSAQCNPKKTSFPLQTAIYNVLESL